MLHYDFMKVIINLDRDVAANLNAEMRRRKIDDFEETINDLLRQALLVRHELDASEAFKVSARRMGNKPSAESDNVGELLEQLEGTDHK